MRKNAAPRFIAALSIAPLCVMAACSSSASNSDAGAGGCQPYVSTANLDTPVVSFAADVMPILSGTCAVNASCHGDPSVVAEGRPLLGYGSADAGMAAAQTILDGLVGVKSSEDLSMNRITAGDPSQSFLMHKLDDDQCTLIAQCMMGTSLRPNCGVFMPYQYPDILDVSTRDVIRRWIHQGARNN